MECGCPSPRVILPPPFAFVVSPLSFFPLSSDEIMFFEHTAKYGLTFANGAEWVKRLEIFAAKDDEINAVRARRRGEQRFSKQGLL